MSKERPTQEILEIEDIRSGVVVLKNGTLRGLLLVSSTNFVLKSTEEQNSVIYQFQGFLNSLDFSCQIICQSRRLNLTGYLEKLKNLEIKQTNPLLKFQTADYHKFIQQFVENQEIFIKNFFVIIPYSSLAITGFSLPGKKESPIQVSEAVFQRAKEQLLQRMEFVALGLRRCGAQSVPLTTSELIELFWSLHHSQEAEIGYYPEIPNELIK